MVSQRKMEDLFKSNDDPKYQRERRRFLKFVYDPRRARIMWNKNPKAFAHFDVSPGRFVSREEYMHYVTGGNPVSMTDEEVAAIVLCDPAVFGELAYTSDGGAQVTPSEKRYRGEKKMDGGARGSSKS